MRILHIIYTDGIAGAEKHLLDLLPGLKKQDIYCELICICLPKNAVSLQKYCNQMDEKGIKTTLLTASRVEFLSTAKKIGEYLRTNRIQIIHSHLFNADLIAVLVKKIYFKELLILSTKHGYREEYLIKYGLGNKKISYNLYYFISRAVIKRIDHNLTVSRSLSNMYYHLKLGKNKMRHIQHGISLPPSNRQQLEIKGAPKIMIVGRLAEVKGHTYLIKALPAVIEKFPDIKLIVLGDGVLKNELIRQATILNVLHHIDFVGFAPPQAYTPHCQLMIQPSLYESFGLVFIESFALKIPIIAFDVEAGNEIIEHNETGILVPKEDSKALAENIIHLLQSPAESKRMIENAYNKYISYYNVERMAKETAEWYYSVLGPEKIQ